MRRYLEGKRVEPPEIEAALGSLREQGYLDDARFARRFAEDKRSLEHWGAERIERRLLARGVERELARAALGEEAAGEEGATALALLRRRFPEPPRDRRERERAFGVLVRRGYEAEFAAELLRAYARGEL
jgi:regulatory protein